MRHRKICAQERHPLSRSRNFAFCQMKRQVGECSIFLENVTATGNVFTVITDNCSSSRVYRQEGLCEWRVFVCIESSYQPVDLGTKRYGQSNFLSEFTGLTVCEY